MTVKENTIRIRNNEEDIEALDKRVTKLESDFNLMMGKLDIIIKMGRVMVGMIAAGLGLDAVLRFTNVSDGTGESAVKKVDVSALGSNSSGQACTEVHIQRIWWSCVGMSVKIDFDASTNVLAIGLPADSTGDEYYDTFTAIPNNAGSGKTGDLDFTTTGHSSGDSYMIILELIKKYD